MPDSPFGEFLGAAASAARQGLSANAALKQLQAAGLGIRRQTFLRAYNELAASIQARYSLLGLPLTGRPSAEMLSQFNSTTSSGFQHIVGIYTRNRINGEVSVSRVSLRANQLMTKQEAEEYGLAAHTENNYEEGSDVIGVGLEEVRQFGRFGAEG